MRILFSTAATLSPFPSLDTPFVDVQRKLVRNESVLGFATGSAAAAAAASASTFALGSEPEADCESESQSPAVLLPISLLFSFSIFVCCGNCGSFVQPPFLCTA